MMGTGVPADKGPNPFVGPRAFEESERELFFGRDLETRQLAALVIAQRVVVLYSPSGAGKTSLVQAGLIPLLGRQKRLVVLPVGRVVGSAAAEGGGAGSSTGNFAGNIYVRNLLVKLVGAGERGRGRRGRRSNRSQQRRGDNDGRGAAGAAGAGRWHGAAASSTPLDYRPV